MKMKTLITCGCILLSWGGNELKAVKMQAPLQKNMTVGEGAYIRVLLEKDASSALLEAKGEYRVINRENGEILSCGSLGKRFVIHALQEGLRWGEEYPGVYRILVAPEDKSTKMFVNGIQYAGSIAVYHSKNNKILVVNEVPIEEYIKSTLNLKYESPLSKEAIAAIAIAARTNAYALTQNKTKRPWDISASEGDYLGSSLSFKKNFVDEAVDWTRFIVMESKTNDGIITNLHLEAEKAQELADRGLDAKKILQKACPNGKLGVTNLPKSVIR
jgi:stage II sporulation protein D